MDKVSVRAIQKQEFNTVAKLHQEMLGDEFIVRFGLRFLNRYYRAFSESPHAVALVAVDTDTNVILGALLGTLDPSLHYRYLTRRHGTYFALIVLSRALFHAALARELIRTRAKRYTQGVLRSLIKKKAKPSIVETSAIPQVSDITHVFVNSAVQSAGVGTALILAYKSLAKSAGVRFIDLVTAPADMNGAGVFYEKLGWIRQRTHMSQSGEEFLMYRLDLLSTAKPYDVSNQQGIDQLSSHKISN